MVRRKTIGKNPLAEPVAGAEHQTIVEPEARRALRLKEALPTLKESLNDAIRGVASAGDPKARAAVGGRLEILGGDIGIGGGAICRFGREERIGFIAPSGNMVDLESEISAVSGSPDRQERRWLSAVGWAWALGSLTGIVGVVAGGGIRLLQPRRMIVEVALRDGRKFVARTDSVTVVGLEHMARNRNRDVMLAMPA
jgi:hypothetical protein